MGSPSAEAFLTMQETLLEFCVGKMLMGGKRFVPNTRKGLIHIDKGDEGLVHFQWLDRTQNEPKAEDDSQLCSLVNNFINPQLEFLGVEEPDAFEPLQVSEDIVEDDISSRAYNLTVTNLGAKAISDVTSSSRPTEEPTTAQDQPITASPELQQSDTSRTEHQRM